MLVRLDRGLVRQRSTTTPHALTLHALDTARMTCR